MQEVANQEAVRAALDALYQAFFEGDTERMLATMSNDVQVRFLGRVAIQGIAEARAFFHSNNASLEDLEFRIRSTVIDGEWAAVVWDETAQALGRPYRNHGVDVFWVVDGRIKVLRVNNDIVARRTAFEVGAGSAGDD